MSQPHNSTLDIDIINYHTTKDGITNTYFFLPSSSQPHIFYFIF